MRNVKKVVVVMVAVVEGVRHKAQYCRSYKNVKNFYTQD